jgi:hypothetical protein
MTNVTDLRLDAEALATRLVEVDLTGGHPVVTLRDAPTHKHPPFIRMMGQGWTPSAKFR